MLRSSISVPTLASIAIGAEILSGCSYPQPYERKSITNEDLQDLTAKTFPIFYEDIRNKWSAEIIKGELTEHTTYKRDGYTAEFYHHNSFVMPSKERIDAVWDFLQSRRGFFRIKQFQPVDRAYIFIGSFNLGDQTHSLTALRNPLVRPLISDSLVDLNDSKKIKGSPFFVELCQTWYSASRGDVMDQEFVCNQFGIAAYFIENNESYETYLKESLQGKVFVQGKEMELFPYDKETYNQLIEIFDKTKINTQTPTISSQSLRRNSKFDPESLVVKEYIADLKERGILTKKNQNYYQEQAILGNFI